MSTLGISVRTCMPIAASLIAWLGSLFSRKRRSNSSQRRLRQLATMAPAADRPTGNGKGKKPGRWLLAGIPAAIALVAAVVYGLSAVKGPEPIAYDNAVWLDRSWTHAPVAESRVAEFASSMREHQIGKIYAYASTLNIEGRWTGGADGKGGFMESRADIAAFVDSFKTKHEEAQIYAWIEIWANLDADDGYRLDDVALHENVANFARLLIDDLGFDGIMLDVKPLYQENDDFIRLIRSVRSVIGLEKPIAVAAPGDLTPNDPGLASLPSIAPGTGWSSNYKQRLMVTADEIALQMYQSYRLNPLDYINWVAYHIETYVRLLETDTRILVSIPNYGAPSAAHDPAVESLVAALDGVILGLSRMEEETRALLTGVAIYSDEDLTASQWNVYRETWLNR